MDSPRPRNDASVHLLRGVADLVEKVVVVLGLLPLLKGKAEGVANEDGGEREEVDVVVVHAKDLTFPTRIKIESKYSMRFTRERARTEA